MTRDEKFGRLLAIANVLSERVFEKDKMTLLEKHITRYSRTPVYAFEKIHKELMSYSSKFGSDELHLLDMFEEMLNKITKEEYSNEKLDDIYVLYFSKQMHALNNMIGVEEAAEILGLSPGTIKNKCASGELNAKKIGKTWVLDKRFITKSDGME